MVGHDWLVGADRRTAGAERIYAAATDLVMRDGLEALDIDVLADRVHCSRATIYRHAGGKAEIRDAVLARAAARIVDTVREAVAGRSGADRVVAAIAVALQRIRADPLGQLMVGSVRGTQELTRLAGSPLLADFARDLSGLGDDDHDAAQWVVRVVLSLLCWPIGDARTEQQILERFVAPAFSNEGDGFRAEI
ncbi:TetR/AcrR family transcriptional regulator [Mycolicibacter arupensis]|uniref:TetR/AcrR family transcriptional regulator n=1 Tax=Mycolicibacter arupensis TaxID=342002 RepID=A0A5C7YAN7_9MYCO|nr:TetR/AcrR family transcriptional regulator [Mycolicibacter arupensis]KAA1431054.1 TetR/AcrR family transcriptional regulator [Mycolicibacter arupensis]TXI58528.1 MAG: TetR/AcrR family transcriptional regulator [Mycolicibacter arupensis]